MIHDSQSIIHSAFLSATSAPPRFDFIIHHPSTICNLQSARMRAHPFPELMGFLRNPAGPPVRNGDPAILLKKRARHKEGTSCLAGPKFPVSDTSHEPSSYRAYTPPHGGQVGGPRPSRPTFIHNSGGLRLLFPCGKSRCLPVTNQSNAIPLRSYGNATIHDPRSFRHFIILPTSTHNFTAMPERNEVPDTFRCDHGFHLIITLVSP